MTDPGKTVGSIVDFFERLITDFTWRRLGVVAAFLILIGSGFVTFEMYTKSFKLARLNQEVSLLERMLEVQDQTAKANDEELKKTFEGLKSELGQLARPTSVKLELSPGWVKGLYASAPWLVLFLIMVLAGTEGAGKGIAGAIIFAIPIVLVGINLPDFNQAWINRWLYPWGSLAVVLALVLFYQKRKNSRPGR